MKSKRIEIPESDGMTIGEVYSRYVGKKTSAHCTYKGKNFTMQYKHTPASTKVFPSGKAKEFPARTMIYVMREGQAEKQAVMCGILMPFALSLDTPMTEAERHF